MSISKLLLVAAGMVCVSTPVAAQQTGRTMDGTQATVNPICGSRPKTAKGTTLAQVVVPGPDGAERCAWSTKSYVDLVAKKQIERSERRPWYQDSCLGYQGDIQYCRAHGPNYGGAQYGGGNYYVAPPLVQGICVPHQNPGSPFWTC